MGVKLAGRENFRVVVEPRGLGDLGFLRTSASFLYGTGPEAKERIERDMLDRCEEIADQIRRHADNVAYVQVESDQVKICEFCGSEWTEHSNVYNGGCCEQDENQKESA